MLFSNITNVRVTFVRGLEIAELKEEDTAYGLSFTNSILLLPLILDPKLFYYEI